MLFGGWLLAATTAAPINPPAVAPDAATLRWEDAEDGRLLFALEDVVRFDWDRQVFELKRERAMDLLAYMAPHRYLSRSFRVRDAQGPIYSGQFVSPVSSMTYRGPTIQTGMAEVDPPLYALQPGYPGRLARDEDQRFAPRLRQALEKAGLLKAIPRNEKPAPIQRLSTEWHGDRASLRVRAEFFPETFRLGQTARVHLFFVPAQTNMPLFDTVQIESSLTQEGGFFCTVDHSLPDRVTPETIKSGVHILRWKPWGPVYGATETVAKPGQAKLSLNVILRKNTPQGQESVCSVAIPAQALTVLPANPP
jgi:hypothetical protein